MCSGAAGFPAGVPFKTDRPIRKTDLPDRQVCSGCRKTLFEGKEFFFEGGVRGGGSPLVLDRMPAKSLCQQAFAPRSGSFSARCAGRKARHCSGCRKSPSDFFDSLSPETVFRLRAFRHWKRERFQGLAIRSGARPEAGSSGAPARARRIRRAAKPPAAAQRVRFGKEPQQNECAVTFEKSRRKRYGTCGDVAERVGFEPTCPCGQLDFES